LAAIGFSKRNDRPRLSGFLPQGKPRPAAADFNTSLAHLRSLAKLGANLKDGQEGEPDAMTDKDYHDIPGTIIFDAEQSRRGYHLNMFCMSLMKDENRKAFKADEVGYLDGFPLTSAQRLAILKRDWNGMLAEGGNIYFTAKIAATDGLSFQQVAALMTGATQEDYAAMMLAGGRSIAGNRSRKDSSGG